MPWNIPQDLKRFRSLTKNSIVIMGRKTYESIGKPLDHRYNFVITKSKSVLNEDVFLFDNIEDSIKFAELNMPLHNIFIIGGESLYGYFLTNKLVNKIYQTVIHKDFDGDTFFSFKESNWELIDNEKEKMLIDGDLIDCSFLTWGTKKPRR
jgi:dihydrofolate reductase